MPLTPSPDLSAADWITASAARWPSLIEFGPPGFPAYARLRFLPDPVREGQSENDVEADDAAASESDRLRAALQTLADHTRTPDDCFFCLWDGWGWTVQAGSDQWTLGRDRPTAATVDLLVSSDPPPPGVVPALLEPTGAPSPPQPPKVVLPDRAYFLFRGRISDFGSWPPAPSGPDVGRLPDPALVWPADHAWCLARDVDPHWAGVGASTAAIEQLLADPGLDVVCADPLMGQPRYR